MIKLRTLVIASFLILPIATNSTIAAERIGMGSLHFQTGFPQGDFKDHLDDNSYGLDGEFIYSPGKSPLGIGLSLGFGVYGSEERREPFSSTIPDVTVKVTTTNNILQGHLVFRVLPKQGQLRPYADGLIGFNYLFTETKISDRSDGDEVASSTNSDDGVFSYGFGGGLLIHLGTSGKESGRQIFWDLDLSTRYLLGDEAEYLKEGSIHIDGTSVIYDKIKSKTDLLTVRLGVAASF
jgi:hypothetical protein